MKPFLFLISGFGTSSTCWEQWDAFFKAYANTISIETPFAHDKSKIGKIRLSDYTNKIIEDFSGVDTGKIQKKVVVAHSTGGIALLKAIQKEPELFRNIYLVLLSSVAPKGIKLVFNARVFFGFLISILKSLPVWNQPGKLDFFSSKWLLTDKNTFSETDRNHIKYYLQPYISGSMGVELFLNFDSLKVNLEIVKKSVKSILVINTMNDKFGNSRKLAKAFNALYVEMEGSHFSYFAGTQVKIITDLIYNLYFKKNDRVHTEV